MSMRKKMKVALLSTVLGSAPITSSVVLPIATQFGKATIGTVVGVGALVAGTIAAVKVFKVGGIAASKIGVGALGKGAIGTAGKIGAGTLGKGAIGTAGLLGSATVAAKAEAITMLQTIAMTTLKRNSTILTKEKFSPLYIKYPELSKALGNPNKLDNIARLNPEFSDDLALAMYRSNPELFTLGF